MTKPTALITGASGMLGRSLAKRLAGDYTLVGVDVQEPPSDSPLDSVHYLDVTSNMSTREALEAIRDEHGDALAAVVHLAAYYDFSGGDSPLYEKVTVEGTRRLLDTLETFDVDRFVFTSTMLVHAPVKPGERIDEGSPIDAKWAYPQSKVETEKVITEHTPRIPYTLLRIAGVYTDFGKQPTLVHQIERIHEQDFESFFFPGDTDAGQSLVHLDDAVEALALTIDRRNEVRDGPILIGEPDPMGYAELQDRIGELLWGEEWPTVRVPASLAKAAAWIEERISEGSFIKPYMIELADDHYALDIGRARRELGWEPERRLEDVLPKMTDMLEEYPVAWKRANGLMEPEVELAESVGS
ncbi:MAG: NAD(P)-dependent oxidoreductase [Gemmatimonadota bacterium]|jgi:UDP-glucose 4-epimerase